MLNSSMAVAVAQREQVLPEFSQQTNKTPWFSVLVWCLWLEVTSHV